MTERKIQKIKMGGEKVREAERGSLRGKKRAQSAFNFLTPVVSVCLSVTVSLQTTTLSTLCSGTHICTSNHMHIQPYTNTAIQSHRAKSPPAASTGTHICIQQSDMQTNQSRTCGCSPASLLQPPPPSLTVAFGNHTNTPCWATSGVRRGRTSVTHLPSSKVDACVNVCILYICFCCTLLCFCITRYTFQNSARAKKSETGAYFTKCCTNCCTMNVAQQCAKLSKKTKDLREQRHTKCRNLA